MVLRVEKPAAQPKVKVVYNYGAAPYTSTAAPAANSPSQNPNVTQGRTNVAPRQGSVAGVVQGPTAQQVAAAAEIVRNTIAAAVEQQRQAARVQVQAQVTSNTTAYKAALSAKVTTAAAPRLKVAKSPKMPKIQVPDQRTEYEKQHDKAYLDALREVDRQRQGGTKKGLSKLWDKVSFGQDRRDVAARGYAEKKLSEISDKKVSDYSKRLKSFLAEQAARRAKIQATKFVSQTAFDRAVADYTSWETAHIAGFEHDRASITGFAEGLKKAGAKPLATAAGKALGGFNTVVAKPVEAALGKVWQYTLGSGDKNIPSLVTAPSRFVNFLGNVNTPNRTIYNEGGTSFNRQGSKLNAWQATQNQRNINLKPWTDINWRTPQAHKMFDAQVQSLINARKQNNPGRKPDDPDKLLRGFVDAYNNQHKLQNTGLDLAADPLNFTGSLGSAAKSLGLTGKLSKAASANSFVSKITSALDKVKSTKAVSWLTAESKLPNQKLFEAIDVAKVAQGEAQKSLLPRINELNKHLAGSAKFDVSVLSDIEKLTDEEAKVLQRMVDGKVAGLDRLKFVDVRGLRGGMAAHRARLEDIARRYTDFTEKLKLADHVEHTRFGKGKKLYSPRTAWLAGSENGLDDYNFFKAQKGKAPQSSKDFYQGIVDRYFKSNVDNTFAGEQTAKRGIRTAQRDALLKRYDNMVEPARAAVLDAHKKTRTPYGRARTFLSKRGPTALWKKSVLKYRPAWYINNFLYNTQAAALSGGGRALVEQARLMRPGKLRRALDEVPAEVKTKVANEIGKGRIAKFGNNVENLSRVAAYRALKKKGFSDDQAIKRVNKYLFDYSTKNWERPLKAVVPFWSFQKNLAKAAVQMPFDRPIAAQVYNKLDEHQQRQFDTDFDKVVPRLRELGYSDAEIDAMRQENAKYFRGRLKVGGKYTTTPFNAFSEKGVSNVGVNPYLSALGEVATATDSFGRPTSGREAGFGARFTSKFPHAQIAKEGINKFLISSGRRKPTNSWIGAPGSEGYGLTKQAQGYDAKKPNYQAGLDPGAKFTQDLAAFLGQPRGLKFDTTKFLERKTMQKLKTEYFATDWNKLEFPEAEAKRNALFKKYGVTADKFYKGELSKYDSAETTRIKSMKEDAYKKTKALFAEYGRQPKGTRNVWATEKLKQLVDSGYFDKNPFLKSFDWTTPATIQKAYKKIAYDLGAKTRDWSVPEKKYAKKRVRDEGRIAAALFWKKYAESSQIARKKLLADNPAYNTRANWTSAMWTAWRADEKTKLRTKVSSLNGFSARLFANTQSNRQKAIPQNIRDKRAKFKKLVFAKL